MKAPSAQPDHFVHDRLPPAQALPTLRYDTPELRIPEQANLVQALFDQAERAGHGDRPLLRGPQRTYSYREARTEAREARALAQARQAFMTTRFKPGEVNGQPVRARLRVAVEFEALAAARSAGVPAP